MMSLIAGSGVAGIVCGAELCPRGAGAGAVEKGADALQQRPGPGGVAAVVDKENDDFRLHIADTLIAGGYKNNLRSLEILVNEGPEDVLRLLKEMHVDFDRDSEHHISMTLEGGHSRRRILHHKDSTGREITEKLLAAAMEKPNITFLDYAQLVNLVPGRAASGRSSSLGTTPGAVLFLLYPLHRRHRPGVSVHHQLRDRYRRRHHPGA